MRERILQAATQEFMFRGARFTVDAVAARLGISKKTLYQYFSSKKELVLAIVDSSLNEVMTLQNEAMVSQEDFLTRLKAFLSIRPKGVDASTSSMLLEDLQKYFPEAWEKVSAYNQKRSENIIKLLEEGRKKDYVRDINYNIAARLIFISLQSLTDPQFLSKYNITPQDASFAFEKIFLTGVLKHEMLDKGD